MNPTIGAVIVIGGIFAETAIVALILEWLSNIKKK